MNPARSLANPHEAPERRVTASPPRAAQAAPSSTPVRRVADDFWPLAALLGLPLGLTLCYLPYYLMPPAARLRSPLHALLKPGANVGLALGLFGLALFLFMWLYPLRKQVRWLAWTGPLGAWMRIHTLAGLALPVLVAVHAGWRFDGLIGLGYLSMVVVSLSGLVGRYLYVRIPRSRSGLELSLEDVSGERRALLTRIAAATGLEPVAVERSLGLDPRPYEGLDPLRTLVRMAKDDWARGSTLRKLRREWSTPRPGRRPLGRRELGETLKLARREMTLSQQMRMLDATRRVFGYWHIAHRPFAITALIAVLVHVVVAIVVGGVGFRS